MNEAKPFWASRTLYVNLLMVLGALLESFGVTSVLNPEMQQEAIGVIMGVVNIILRFVTTQPVTLTQ